MKCNLQTVLDRKGISQRKLAKDTGIGKNIISELCRNKANSVSFVMMTRICNALECDLAEIFPDE